MDFQLVKALVDPAMLIEIEAAATALGALDLAMKKPNR
jgi:hypothetical protein